MILLCALPSATISAMFANEAEAYRSEAATSILVSTVLSLVTFSAVIYLIPNLRRETSRPVQVAALRG